MSAVLVFQTEESAPISESCCLCPGDKRVFLTFQCVVPLGKAAVHVCAQRQTPACFFEKTQYDNLIYCWQTLHM
jgi:hypothetical protein